MAKQPTNHEAGLLPTDQLVDLVAGFIRECRARPAAEHSAPSVVVAPVQTGDAGAHPRTMH